MTDLSKMSLEELRALRARVAGTAAPSAPATPGPRPVASGDLIQQQIGSPAYKSRASSALADQDIKLNAQAQANVKEGSDTLGRAKEISPLLQQTYTGPGAYFSAIGSIPQSGFQDLTNLSTIKRTGGKGIFGDLELLKGAISDKDVKFLREQQIDPGKTRQENQRIVNLMEWTGVRAKAYEGAMNAWANRLGSPSAKNARGQSFVGWWEDWSEKNIPRPGVSESKPQGNPRFKVISVEDVQ
jgi:hypothetical protein